MIIPVDVKLYSPCDAYRHFTYKMDFGFKPTSGDYIMALDNCVLEVVGCIHYGIGTVGTIINTSKYRCDTYDSMVKLFEDFEGKYSTDLYASNDLSSKSHQRFYRILLKMVGLDGSSQLTADQLNMKMIAESCRSILLGELFRNSSISQLEFDEAFGIYNPLIERLYETMLTHKRLAGSSDLINMYDIIKEWEPTFNKGSIKWDSDFDSYVKCGRLVFAKVKSIAPTYHPSILKT